MKIRDDKSWDQATTSDQFAEMYRKQIKEAPARPEVVLPGQMRRLSEDAEDRDDDIVDVAVNDDDDDDDDEEGVSVSAEADDQ